MITSKNNKTEIQILSNIKEKYLVDSYPHLFNKKTIKNLFTFNNPTKYVQFQGDNLEKFSFNINNCSRDVIWISKYMPYLQEFFNKLKN